MENQPTILSQRWAVSYNSEFETWPSALTDEPTKLIEENKLMLNEDTEDSKNSIGSQYLTDKPKIKQKCVFNCTNYKLLHVCPKDFESREIWRKKLKLKRLAKSHKLCDNHFTMERVRGGRKRKHLSPWSIPDSPDRKERNEVEETITIKMGENAENVYEVNKTENESINAFAMRMNSLKNWLQTDEFSILRSKVKRKMNSNVKKLETNNLDKFTATLFNAAKQIRTEKNFKFAYLENGKVYMRKSEADRPIRVGCLEDLHKL